MDALSPMIVSFTFLGISMWLLNRNRYARYMIKPMRKYSWLLTKKMLAYIAKLLRKMTLLFDTY